MSSAGSSGLECIFKVFSSRWELRLFTLNYDGFTEILSSNLKARTDHRERMGFVCVFREEIAYAVF